MVNHKDKQKNNKNTTNLSLLYHILSPGYKLPLLCKKYSLNIRILFNTMKLKYNKTILVASEGK